MTSVLLTSFVLSACANGQTLPKVTLKDQSFAVELAQTPKEMERGLMFRRKMNSDAGMLFVYETAFPQSFWMKNTYIPLDILFFDQNARFVGAHYRVPICSREPCPNYSSPAPARYVLELNAGIGQQLKLRVGDQLGLPDSLQ